MKWTHFYKLYLISFIVLFSEFNTSAQELNLEFPYAVNELKQYNNECPRVGSISGRIIVPENENYVSQFNNEIAIRIVGIDYSHEESKRFEYYPDKEGCFAIDNIFPVGSSVSLYIWDKQSILNNKVIPAYVGLKTNYYNISMSSQILISELSKVFSKGTVQALESTGVCGYAIGLSPGDILGTSVNITNIHGKKFTAKYYDHEDIPSIYNNELTENGHFCFFNLNSCEEGMSTCSSNSDYYKLSFFLKNGMTRSFNLYLPRYTFSDYNYYELNAAVYRPIEALSVKNYFGDLLTSSWTSVPKFNLRSSNYYSSVDISKKENKSDLVYFPLGDDFITLNYKMESAQSDRFFILKPRAEIFTDRFVSVLKSYEPGQIFVDKKDPVLLKIFEPHSLNLKQEYLSPLYNVNLGSLFLSLGLSKYGINKNFAYVFLRDLSGEQVSSFVPIKNSDHQNINGFFYNLNPGMYQLFVVNGLNGDILFTSVVQSYANKTQVITDVIENVSKKYEYNQTQHNQVYVVNSYSKMKNQGQEEIAIIPWNERAYDNSLSDIVPDDGILPNNSKSISDLQQEKIYFKKNIFNKYNSELLCSFKPAKPIAEKIIITENKFMGFIPQVNFLPSEQIIGK